MKECIDLHGVDYYIGDIISFDYNSNNTHISQIISFDIPKATIRVQDIHTNIKGYEEIWYLAEEDIENITFICNKQTQLEFIQEFYPEEII